MLLTDKVVIVTGAGGGLGEGIARVCHREGARVVVADIRGDAASKVAGSLGEAALAVTCDVGNDEARSRLVDASIAECGRIDGLVNNAGVNFVRAFLETTVEDWERVIRVDLRAVFFFSQLVCRQMLAQESGGSIVNISSVHSVAALPGAGPYDAAKTGVVGLTKSIAVEMAAANIRVNAISPGLLNTQIWKDLLAAAPDPERAVEHWNSNIPIARAIEPEEVGELAAFLLSDRSKSITGANILADGGMTSQLTSREPYESRSIEGH
ncbi:MAG: SDR family oxidoreductase [Chloroflexi bacterium]|nr:SDR family oxidoreductase [Chloroflexota bacterium]